MLTGIERIAIELAAVERIDHPGRRYLHREALGLGLALIAGAIGPTASCGDDDLTGSEITGKAEAIGVACHQGRHGVDNSGAGARTTYRDLTIDRGHV